jgi:hypothetical protein
MPQFRSRDGRSTAIPSLHSGRALAVRMGKMPMLRSPKLRHYSAIKNLLDTVAEAGLLYVSYMPWHLRTRGQGIGYRGQVRGYREQWTGRFGE